MATDRKSRLQDFVAWAAAHITGDEKGEAQIFLDRPLQAFAQRGVLETGKAELRIRKAKEDGGGTFFADFVWKPLVLIEMKKRGADLRRHYRQAFDYWTRLVPGRPNYVVLSNFDEFWIYDFDVQLDEPMDRLKIEELPNRYGPLAFLIPTEEKPVFKNNQVEVTREAANRLAVLFNKLERRHDIDRATAQRFVLQCLIALFAVDIGLLENNIFAQVSSRRPTASSHTIPKTSRRLDLNPTQLIEMMICRTVVCGSAVIGKWLRPLTRLTRLTSAT